MSECNRFDFVVDECPFCHSPVTLARPVGDGSSEWCGRCENCGKLLMAC